MDNWSTRTDLNEYIKVRVITLPGLVWLLKLIDNDDQPIDSANFYSISCKIQYREWFNGHPGRQFNFCYTSKGTKINRRRLKEERRLFS